MVALLSSPNSKLYRQGIMKWRKLVHLVQLGPCKDLNLLQLIAARDSVLSLSPANCHLEKIQAERIMRVMIELRTATDELYTRWNHTNSGLFPVLTHCRLRGRFLPIPLSSGELPIPLDARVSLSRRFADANHSLRRLLQKD